VTTIESPRPIEAPNIQLRDYQCEAITRIREGRANGITRQLVALPTGTGKTVIFSMLPVVFGGERMLVIAHREELLEQAAEKIGWANPLLKIDIEMAHRTASGHADVVVGSIQSLSGPHGRERLERLSPDSFGLLVVDEVHHALARTYLELLARFGKAPDLSDLEGKASSAALHRALDARYQKFTPDPKSLFVGFTATPHRTDGIGLQYIMDEIVFSRTIREMMSAPAPGPWLSPIRGYKFDTGVDLTKVKSRMGDYQTGELSSAVNNDDRNIAAVKAYVALASGRQSICFCVDVAHCLAMLDQFTDFGVSAACVLGDTDSEERQQTIAAFKAGRIEVLVNCMVLTEGFDHDKTSCIIMARPTKSQLLYTQMLGRGTRLADGKKDLMVIDLVDFDTSKVGVANVNTLFGLPPKMATKDGLREAQDEFELIVDELGIDPGMLDGAQSLAEVRQMAREYNPLGIPMMPSYLRHRLAWARTSYGCALMVNKDVTIGIVVDMLDHAQIQIRRREPGTIAPPRTEIHKTHDTLEQAVWAAEQMVYEDYPTDAYLIDKNAGWRKRGDSASEAQKGFMDKLCVEYEPGISKADAATKITHKLANSKRGFAPQND